MTPEESLRIKSTRSKIKATRLNRTDRWDRPLAKDEQGNIYCDVSLGRIEALEDWHTVTPEGEPSYPVRLNFDPTRIDRPTY